MVGMIKKRGIISLYRLWQDVIKVEKHLLIYSRNTRAAKSTKIKTQVLEASKPIGLNMMESFLKNF